MSKRRWVRFATVTYSGGGRDQRFQWAASSTSRYWDYTPSEFDSLLKPLGLVLDGPAKQIAISVKEIAATGKGEASE